MYSDSDSDSETPLLAPLEGGFQSLRAQTRHAPDFKSCNAEESKAKQDTFHTNIKMTKSKVNYVRIAL